MLVVTGGAGFIGSNLVAALNTAGHDDIVVVDDLSDGHKFSNLLDCHIADYLDIGALLPALKSGALGKNLRAVFHLGACSSTTEWDGRYMMENNYEYSKQLFHFCSDQEVPFIYASSAAVYGGGETFTEQEEFERPLNVYGYSKYLFDQYVRRHQKSIRSQLVGLRYFNVYGPHEQHKGAMASVAWHLHQQALAGETVKLFSGSAGYEDGEQRRDFVSVHDTVQVKLWLLQHPQVSGVFNIGTGRAQTFNEVAQAVIAWHAKKGRQIGLEYIDFPAHLQGHYQAYTQADMSALRKAGYDAPFMSVQEGVDAYLSQL